MDISVENLCKSFGEKLVFNNFNCIFKEGRINCLMGKSGIGKTTLLSIIMRTQEPDSGIIKGIDSKKISVVFQENRLCENLSAILNIKLVTNKSDSEIINILNKVEIDGENAKPVSEYSGGMMRRVAVVRALMAEYDILIMDEPLKGLDESTKMLVVNLIKEMSAGKTIIMVTHNIAECELLGAELVNMD